MKTIYSLILILALAPLASAQLPPLAPQQQGPQLRPVISPYMSLFNNNRPSYQNYYGGGGVLQQQQLYNSINTFNQQIAGLQNSPQATFPGTGSELSTGKVPGFFTHRGYFLNRGGVQIARGTAGQYGTSGNNSLYSNQPTSNVNQNQPQQNNSIMPYRR